MVQQIGVTTPITPGQVVPSIGEGSAAFSQKQISVFDISAVAAQNNQGYQFGGTCIYILHDILKFPNGVPAGCYFSYDDPGTGKIPIPRSNVDSAGNVIAIPILFIGGVPFTKLFFTTPAGGAGFGFSVLTCIDGMDDFMRV